MEEGGISSETLEVKNKLSETGYLVYQKQEENFEYIFISAEPSIWMPAEDSKGRILDDRYFTKASVQYNEAFQAMVEITFNTEGAEIF